MAKLPADVEQFIDEHIESIEQLEILLLLGSQPLYEFEPREVAHLLRLGAESAPALLARMEKRGLASARGEPKRYRYAPRSAEIERLVNELARCYAERRVTVISRIFSPRSTA